MTWLKRNAPVVLLAAALLAAAVLLLALERNLTFFQDTWAFLMHRHSLTADSLLEPHNEHIVLIPVAIETSLVALFGMSSAAPEQVAMTLVLLAVATLVFVYARRRVGPWPALFAAVLLLFVGPAWQVLLWPFEIGFAGSLLCGIAMLLALDRDDRRGDVWACVFLVLSIGFSSLGVAFVVGAAVDVLQRRRARGLGRAWVAAIPLLLYAAWWVGWGHTAESHLSLDNVLSSPRYVFEGFASSLDSILGLSTISVDGSGEPLWGRPILVALIALAGYRFVRGARPSPRFWPLATAAAVFWLLAAFNFIPSREAYSSRYQYVGAAFVLLLAAELLRGMQPRRQALIAAGAVTVFAVASNLVPLREGKDWLRAQTVLTRSDLGAVEIARRSAEPTLVLTPEVAGTASLIDVEAGNFLAIASEDGSPAYSPDELETAPPEGRRQADLLLAAALPLSTRTLSDASSPPAGRCTELAAPGEPPPMEVPLKPGATRIELGPGAPAALSLRRFASGEYPVALEAAPANSTTVLHIPPDTAPQPWYLHVETTQRARLCR